MVEFNLSKLKELIVYLATREADDPAFGATKLDKILFFSDFDAYLRFGQPITGATYQCERFGPVPREMPRVQRELEREGAVQLERRERYGFPQKRLMALREPNLSLFSQEEIAVVDAIADDLRRFNAIQASEFSHQLAVGWQLAAEGEEIPYFTAFLTGEAPTQDDIERGQELAREHGWLEPAV